MSNPNPKTAHELAEEIIKQAIIGLSYDDFHNEYRLIDYRYEPKTNREFVHLTLSEMVDSIAKMLDDGKKGYGAVINDDEKETEFIYDILRSIPILTAMHADHMYDFGDMIVKYFKRT